MDSNILMESGTNELEILEFMIDDHCYGINVAKIKEIITFQEVTPVPNAHPSIEGIFMPRDAMITAIDLRNCLQRGASEPGGLFIITNFNKSFFPHVVKRMVKCFLLISIHVDLSIIYNTFD